MVTDFAVVVCLIVILIGLANSDPPVDDNPETRNQPLTSLAPPSGADWGFLARYGEP